MMHCCLATLDFTIVFRLVQLLDALFEVFFRAAALMQVLLSACKSSFLLIAKHEATTTCRLLFTRAAVIGADDGA